MDYEILKEGNFYVDPTTKDSYCTWLYTSVPADFEFPNMEYELIEKCFIPEELEYENLHLSANSSESLRFEELIYRAYDRVGAAHLFEIPQESTQNSNDLRKGWFDNFIKWVSGYKPKGTITVHDTSLDDYFYVKGILTPKEVYDCLTQNINTHEKLKDKLMLTYPSKASTIKKNI